VDAIQLVKQDHRTVEGLFKGFERAAKAEKHAEMRRLVRDMTKELSIHAVIEEAILYRRCAGPRSRPRTRSSRRSRSTTS
jgi:hemerythrin superfamily protein